MGIQLKKFDFNAKRNFYNIHRRKVDQLNGDIKRNRDDRNRLNNDFNRTSKWNIIRRTDLGAKILDLDVKNFVQQQQLRDNNNFMNFWRGDMEKFERNNEEEFLLNSQSIVEIKDNNERELYFYRLGKRLEKRLYDEITNAEKSLENNKRRKEEIERVNYLLKILV